MTHVMVTERVVEQASALDVDPRGDAHFILRRDGRDDLVPPELNRILTQILHTLGSAGAVSVRSLPAELTTTMAAQILDVSRPTLMKMIQREEIPAHKVGTHFRVKTVDVLELQKIRIERQLAALERLREWDVDD